MQGRAVIDREHTVPLPDYPKQLSEQDKRIADHIAELTAQLVLDRLLTAVQSDDIASRVIDTWGGKIDRTIGRGLRRLGFYVLIGLIGIGAFKLGLTEKFLNFLKP